MPDDLPEPEGPENLNEPPSFFPKGFDEVENGSTRLLQAEVEGTYGREEGASRDYFVVLRAGYRRLPIVIDPCNAYAISVALGGEVLGRPLGSDLLKSVMERLGGELDCVFIDDLWSTTYYAKLVIKREEGEPLEIDSRPSDAIALAIRCQSPIYVSESIMEAAGE